mmetsp:Transcript_105107/g.307144  ORF Transcript_105107/g.307144 Transcript_105107/m.307144 type:complete len:277 (+) Transcript_105107:347-1177(+)
MPITLQELLLERLKEAVRHARVRHDAQQRRPQSAPEGQRPLPLDDAPDALDVAVEGLRVLRAARCHARPEHVQRVGQGGGGHAGPCSRKEAHGRVVQLGSRLPQPGLVRIERGERGGREGHHPQQRGAVPPPETSRALLHHDAAASAEDRAPGEPPPRARLEEDLDSVPRCNDRFRRGPRKTAARQALNGVELPRGAVRARSRQVPPASQRRVLVSLVGRPAPPNERLQGVVDDEGQAHSDRPLDPSERGAFIEAAHKALRSAYGPERLHGAPAGL